ncbi:hypothetical protein ACHQM5_027567 [Ranunculus cassubicifolius]
MGRKKIQIEKIQSLKPRHVTFSKRRAGLFNKAQVQSALCGSETTMVVFSPGGRVFTFGKPEVLSRFVAQFGESGQSQEIPAESATIMDVQDRKKGADETKELKNDNNSIDTMLEELQERKKVVEELLAKVRGKLDKSWLSL